jgi:hypothetical protein
MKATLEVRIENCDLTDGKKKKKRDRSPAVCNQVGEIVCVVVLSMLLRDAIDT